MNTSLKSSCSFFGHRKINISAQLREKLSTILESLIKNGCIDFYFGGFGEFDDLCYSIISKLKTNYDHIRRIYCICDQRLERSGKRPKWLNDNNYEEIIYIEPSFNWWYQRIYFRNIEIIEKSDIVIFFVEKTAHSGAYKALQYVQKRKKEFINIANI